jgi:hypothetical protein
MNNVGGTSRVLSNSASCQSGCHGGPHKGSGSLSLSQSVGKPLVRDPLCRFSSARPLDRLRAPTLWRWHEEIRLQSHRFQSYRLLAETSALEALISSEHTGVPSAFRTAAVIEALYNRLRHCPRCDHEATALLNEVVRSIYENYDHLIEVSSPLRTDIIISLGRPYFEALQAMNAAVARLKRELARRNARAHRFGGLSPSRAATVVESSLAFARDDFLRLALGAWAVLTAVRRRQRERRMRMARLRIWFHGLRFRLLRGKLARLYQLSREFFGRATSLTGLIRAADPALERQWAELLRAFESGLGRTLRRGDDDEDTEALGPPPGQVCRKGFVGCCLRRLQLTLPSCMWQGMGRRRSSYLRGQVSRVGLCITCETAGRMTPWFAQAGGRPSMSSDGPSGAIMRLFHLLGRDAQAATLRELQLQHDAGKGGLNPHHHSGPFPTGLGRRVSARHAGRASVLHLTHAEGEGPTASSLGRRVSARHGRASVLHLTQAEGEAGAPSPTPFHGTASLRALAEGEGHRAEDGGDGAMPPAITPAVYPTSDASSRAKGEEEGEEGEDDEGDPTLLRLDPESTRRATIWLEQLEDRLESGEHGSGAVVPLGNGIHVPGSWADGLRTRRHVSKLSTRRRFRKLRIPALKTVWDVIFDFLDEKSRSDATYLKEPVYRPPVPLADFVVASLRAKYGADGKIVTRRLESLVQGVLLYNGSDPFVRDFARFCGIRPPPLPDEALGFLLNHLAALKALPTAPRAVLQSLSRGLGPPTLFPLLYKKVVSYVGGVGRDLPGSDPPRAMAVMEAAKRGDPAFTVIDGRVVLICLLQMWEDDVTMLRAQLAMTIRGTARERLQDLPSFLHALTGAGYIVPGWGDTPSPQSREGLSEKDAERWYLEAWRHAGAPPDDGVTLFTLALAVQALPPLFRKVVAFRWARAKLWFAASIQRVVAHLNRVRRRIHLRRHSTCRRIQRWFRGARVDRRSSRGPNGGSDTTESLQEKTKD